MNNFVLAFVASTLISSPVLAQSGDNTSRLDVPTTVLSPDTTAVSGMMMDEVAVEVSASDSSSLRGSDVNGRPYDRYGNFRF